MKNIVFDKIAVDSLQDMNVLLLSFILFFQCVWFVWWFFCLFWLWFCLFDCLDIRLCEAYGHSECYCVVHNALALFSYTASHYVLNTPKVLPKVCI